MTKSSLSIGLIFILNAFRSRKLQLSDYNKSSQFRQSQILNWIFFAFYPNEWLSSDATLLQHTTFDFHLSQSPIPATRSPTCSFLHFSYRSFRSSSLFSSSYPLYSLHSAVHGSLKPFKTFTIRLFYCGQAVLFQSGVQLRGKNSNNFELTSNC